MIKLLAKLLSLKTLAKNNAPFPSDNEVASLISEIRAAKLSYCGPPKLENIAETVLSLRRQEIPGLYIEAGVALGGSAILLGRLKQENTKLYLYDVYGLIPPPGDNDGEDAHRRYQEIASGASKGIGENTYYGYVDQLIDVVRENLRRFGLDESKHVTCIPGLFENTLRVDTPVALAHIDCDWYESVKVCIERIAPNLSRGGVIIFDDYSSYSGCKRAVDEWLSLSPEFNILFDQRSLGVVRIS